MLYGHQLLLNTNSSMNSASDCSSFRTFTSSSLLCSFSTFSNNIVSAYISIAFSFNSGTISNSNIIHNNSPTNGVLYVWDGNHYLKTCVFYRNMNTLLHVRAGSLTLSDSNIDHIGTILNGAVTTSNNNSFTKTNSYQIEFFGTHFCNVDKLSATMGNTKVDPCIRVYLVFLVAHL